MQKSEQVEETVTDTIARNILSTFNTLQYRQELHDRLFHTDIYTLSKQRRLVHLVLHHAKYVCRLYTLIKVYSADASERVMTTYSQRIENTAIDGIIVCLSMMNCCNFQMTCFTETDEWDNDTPLNLLMLHVGMLAKTVEDIDHLSQNDPLRSIVESTKVMLTAYFKLLSSTGGDFNYQISRVYNRLTEVEKLNIFYNRHRKEMSELLDSRR